MPASSLLHDPHDSRRRPSRTSGRAKLTILAVAAAVSLLIAADPAAADTASASARSIKLSILNAPIIAPTAAAANDGTQATQTDGFTNAALSILPANTIVSAGALGQLAVANADGSSQACAGLIAPSAAITIGANGSCTTGASTTGIGIDLLGLAALKAGAITASCSASSTGAPSGSSNLANAAITGPLGIPLASLDANPAPNTGLDLLGAITIMMNKQVVLPDGSLEVTALEISVLGTGIEIGTVTCGPNTVTGAVPLISGPVAPASAVVIAGGLAIGLTVRSRSRRRALK